MSEPDRDYRDCIPSSPPVTSSHEEKEHITFREKTATPSEEGKVGLLKGRGAAFPVKTLGETSGLQSVAKASAEAEREDSQNKGSCSNEIQTGASVDGRSIGLKPDFIGPTYPTRFENLSPG